MKSTQQLGKTGLKVLDGKGNLIRKWNSTAEKPPEKIEPVAGMNRFVWNLRYADAEDFPGMILWGSLTGPKASPGMYQVRIKHGDTEQSSMFVLKPDPRSTPSPKITRLNLISSSRFEISSPLRTQPLSRFGMSESKSSE